MASYLTFRTFAVPQAGEWIPVHAPIACSAISIENATGFGSVLIRASESPESVKRLPANAEIEFRSSVATWDTGDEICQVKAGGSDTSVCITFLR